MKGLDPQNFNRDLAPESRVASAIDLAHPARTERCQDFIGAQPVSSQKRHINTVPQLWFKSDDRQRNETGGQRPALLDKSTEGLDLLMQKSAWQLAESAGKIEACQIGR